MKSIKTKCNLIGFICLSVLSLSFILLFVKLSIWQYDRSIEKSQIIAKTQNISKDINNNLETLNNIKIINKSDNYSLIKLYGSWDNQKSLILANQYHNHKLGFNLITPFIINNQHAVLVNRGWFNTLDLTTSNNLITIKDNSHKIYITGIVNNSNSNQYIMGDNLSKIPPEKLVKTPVKNSKDYIKYQIQKIDLENKNILNLFPYQLSKKYIKLISPKDQGLILDWQWTNISPEKHKAYSLQWLLLAITTVLLYSYLCYKTFIQKIKIS